MLRPVFSAIVLLSLCSPLTADELKTTRIALFSSGVGYFESAMTVDGNSAAELKFRAEQINDVLKSLVLRDLDGGTISTVQYPSRDPVEKALKSFAVDITGKPTLGDLLDQLRGVMVEVKAPSPVTGSILGVEKQTFTTNEKTTIKKDVLTLLTAEGLKSFVLPEVAGVKILDATVEGELRKALETLAASHDSEKKTVLLNFTGQGKRRVRTGYILETPIWKTSYRLVLGEDKQPYLQGWAIVENATEQDWDNVSLSLIYGRPISFTMDLYQPLYVPRPMEQLALYESLRPPTYEGALALKPAEAAPGAPAKASGLARKDVAAEGKTGGIAGGRFLRGGGGGGGGQNPFAGGAAGADEEAGMELDDAGVTSLAAAKEAGELFEYAIQAPVSLKRQQSAMLPIVTAEVQGQKVSIYNPATHPKYPLNGLKLKNTTGLHLMQGPVTVFDAGIYAGDAKLPDLQANEERLLSYALDLAVEVDVKQHAQPEQVTKLWIAKGALWHQRKLVDERVYTINNKDDAARALLVEQPMPVEWQLIEPKEAYERTSTLLRFKVEVAPKKAQQLQVRLERPLDESVALTNLGTDEIDLFLRQPVISDGVKQALTRVIELRRTLDATKQQIAQIEKDIAAIADEQKRLRENMAVLSQTSEVYRRYEQKFDKQETQVEEMRTRLAELRKQEEGQRKALEDFILSMKAE